MNDKNARHEQHWNGPELTAYLLGEASEDERRRIEQHLASCASCRRERTLLEATVKAVSRIDNEEILLDDQARTRVLAAAGGKPPQTGVDDPGDEGSSRRPRLLKLTAYAAALAASILVLAVLVHETVWDKIAPSSGSDSRMLALGEAAAPSETPRPALPGEQMPLRKPETTAAPLWDATVTGGGKPGQAGRTSAAGSAADGAHVVEKERLLREIDEFTITDKAAHIHAGSESRLAVPQVKLNFTISSRTSLDSVSVAPDSSIQGTPPEKSAQAGLYARMGEPPVTNGPAGPPPATQQAAPRATVAFKDGGSSGVAVGGAGGGSAAGAAHRALSRRSRGRNAGASAEARAQLRLATKGKGTEAPQLDKNNLGRPTAGKKARADSPQKAETGRQQADRLDTLGYVDRAGKDDGEDVDDALTEQQKTTAKEAIQAEVTRRIEAIYARLARQPGESPKMMFFRYWGDNPFVEARNDPLSTFAVDVDTSSYTLARRYLSGGRLPPREMVRTEEFVNYFKSGFTPPENGAFRIHAQLAPNRFAHEPGYQILEVGLKGREIARSERRACALTFVVDVSGSMRQGDRLELVKKSLRLLVDQLDEGDSIGIVAFNTNGFEVLQPTAASKKEAILTKIASLAPGGSTNAGEGLQLGYAMASRQLQEGANNRVILCSDGVANTGVTDRQEILRQVDELRSQGILLTCIGVGMGNHNDVFLEQLADKGDGQCFYVDRPAEARRVFVDQLTGTLQTIARDVKIQVAFDPDRVIRYRLLGYENRNVADRDFRNDAVDAGEVGAGHEVVALYELKCRPEASGRVATIRVRYKDVDIPEEVTEIERNINWDELIESFDAAPARFRLSTIVAEFAELLRGSYWAAGDSFEALAPIADQVARDLPDDPEVSELAALVRQARDLKAAIPDDIARALDEVMETNYQIVLVQSGNAGSGGRSTEQTTLEELRRKNEALKDKLEEILLARLSR